MTTLSKLIEETDYFHQRVSILSTITEEVLTDASIDDETYIGIEEINDILTYVQTSFGCLVEELRQVQTRKSQIES